MAAQLFGMVLAVVVLMLGFMWLREKIYRFGYGDKTIDEIKKLGIFNENDGV